MGRWDDDFEDDEQEFVEPKKAEAGLTRKPQVEDTDSSAPTPRVVKSGWGSSERFVGGGDSDFAKRLKVTNEIQIIKFLDDAPYARYRQHWVERKGQMSFTCIADFESGTTCPLCEAGSRPSWRFNFNVVLMTPGEEPVVRSYEVGARVIDQLKNFNEHPAMGPLYKHYWTASKSGKGATTSTNHQMVREDDLSDWGLKPLTKEQLKSLSEQAYTEDIIRTPSRKTLASIALEIQTDD